ncbi:hypothetical protein COHA_001987 [Chlorella ohadii]|uniref:BZIP domain-containing protein n=1 Tax=Chlorella ohadii TaxID=2649997 RepID=A0AAD5DYA5_9CHLO|nr:hypothetical protein COHA_001987 [Chlorella ohadii]
MEPDAMAWLPGPGADAGLDLDGLQNFFNATGPSGMPDPLMMQQGFRGGLPPMGGLPGGLQGGFGGAAPTANLFSSIPGLNDAAMLGAAAPATTAGPASGADPDSGDSSGGGGGGGRGKKSAEQRAAAVQEKNRRAQKRFRERQKAKMKDMGEQLEDMSSELSKLRVENNSLKNRNTILEKVLALRDEHIRMLQDEQQVGGPGGLAVFDLGNHYLQSSSQKLLTGGAAGAGALTLGTTAGPLTTMEIKAVKGMPSEAVIGRWKETVRELGNILVQIEGCPDTNDARHQAAMQALCQVLDSAGQLCMHTAVLHPTNMQKLIAATLDDGRSGVTPEDRTRWAAVTQSLQLSNDQRAQIISLRAIFLRRMTKVMEERRDILAKLQMVNIPDRMMALQSVISETLKVNECTAELKANLQEEHLAGMEFIGTVFKTILSPLQKARAIVQSYPFYPDVYQIATVLALEKQGPAALQSLEAATASGMAGGSLITIPTAYKR